MPRRVDPVVFLHEQFAAIGALYETHIVGRPDQLVVDVVSRESGARWRWQSAWTRSTSPAANRRAENRAYRETISYLAECGIIAPPIGAT